MSDNITLPRAIVQQALEALKSAAIFVDSFRGQKATQDAITALRKALEQQAEPDRWVIEKVDDKLLLNGAEIGSGIIEVRLDGLTYRSSEKVEVRQQAEPVHGDIRALKYRIHELEGEVIGYKRMLDVAEAASQPQRKQLPPVDGDLLPPVGSQVLIHLASQDKWVEHTVVGYYVWGAFDSYSLHRVFVRVQDSDGILNARILRDVRSLEAANGIKEGT